MVLGEPATAAGRTAGVGGADRVSGVGSDTEGGGSAAGVGAVGATAHERAGAGASGGGGPATNDDPGEKFGGAPEDVPDEDRSIAAGGRAWGAGAGVVAPPADTGEGGAARERGAGGPGGAAGVGGDAGPPAGHVSGAQAGPPAEQRVGRLRRLGSSRAALLIGVLCGLLGFGLAVQVRSNTATSGLTTARQEDLVRILDDLSSREERLRRQIAALEAARTRLTTTGDRNSAALAEARTRSVALGILAGTLPAQGPGIELRMTDPNRKLTGEDVLDAVEELRAAGAEAIQVGPVRVGLETAFTEQNGQVVADGATLPVPYVVTAIGDPGTLATALDIPGGVVDTVRQAGGTATVRQQQRVVIRALRAVPTPHYAQPAAGQGSGGN